MFIIWLPVWGDKKLVQDKRFDSHLIGIRNSKRKLLLALQDKIAHHKGFECKIKLQMSHDKNFIKTKSSLSVQKREKIKLCCSPQLKKKQPLFLIINTWVLCRAWWNDVKNTVVHCYSCQKALALTEFSRGICTWPHLALSRKQWSAKDFFKNWRGAIITHRSFAQSIRHYAAGVWG